MNKSDLKTISKIANRGMDIASDQGANLVRLDVIMDLESAHEDCPMNLSRFLDADDFNFAHDFFGIRRHMDRSKYPGKLTDCFVPRHAAEEEGK